MQLLCAGEAFEDLIFVNLDRLPNLGEEVKTNEFTATIGGGAVITSVQAARLGMRTSLLSGLSEPAMKRLRRERVRVTNLRKPNEPHAITAALSTADDRAFVTFNGVNAILEPRLATAIPKTDATHVHFCFYPHDCAQWTRIVNRMRKRGVTTSWDFGWNEPLAMDRGLTGLLDALDFVCVNELEARLYTGEPSLDTALSQWRRRQAIVIFKDGERGSSWLAPDHDVRIPAPRVRPVDTTGAGDAFNAGFLVAWMRGRSREQCLAAGNKVGAASTRRAGGI